MLTGFDKCNGSELEEFNQLFSIDYLRRILPLSIFHHSGISGTFMMKSFKSNFHRTKLFLHILFSLPRWIIEILIVYIKLYTWNVFFLATTIVSTINFIVILNKYLHNEITQIDRNENTVQSCTMCRKRERDKFIGKMVLDCNLFQFWLIEQHRHI